MIFVKEGVVNITQGRGAGADCTAASPPDLRVSISPFPSAPNPGHGRSRIRGGAGKGERGGGGEASEEAEERCDENVGPRQHAAPAHDRQKDDEHRARHLPPGSGSRFRV